MQSPAETLVNEPQVAENSTDSSRTNGSDGYDRDLVGSSGQSTPVNGTTECYEGQGTASSPYIVHFLEGDVTNPLEFSERKKWTILVIVSLLTLCVAFGSSVYAGGISAMERYFEASTETLTLGLSLYVLGFVFGPLLFAPLAELYGRRIVFIFSYSSFAIFQIGCASAQNLVTLLVCRFLAGFFGSSPLVNSGGVISDMFDARQRGIAISIWALAPFAGPVLGPIAGGYLGATGSFRWIFWLMAIFAFVMWVAGSLVPETYAPVLLRKRAAELTLSTGRIHVSKYEVNQSTTATLADKLKLNLTRPFVLLFTESIVLLFSVYAAVVYGILYLLFGAFPLVFQVGHNFTPGQGGLAFIGVGIGMVVGVIMNIIENGRYIRVMEAQNGVVAPEERLRMCAIGGCLLPIGLAWFAASTSPSVHWIVPIIGTAFFGAGMVLVFLAMSNYLVDAYLLYAASALAGNAVLRSIFGAAFPLFTIQMFEKLGNGWALGLLSFIALLCVPIPFAFIRYGAHIRRKSRFAPGHVDPPSMKEAKTSYERSLKEEVRLGDQAEQDDVANEVTREGKERDNIV